MTKPRIFIGSSVEGLNIAYAVQQNLLHDAEVTVWDQGVFELSRTTIESLSKALQESDFAVFVFSPDDLTKIRNISSPSVRDNVLFEFGLFIGRLGRERVYFLLPTSGDLHLPTDLLGITPGRYESARSDGSMQAATGAVCHQIRTQIRSLGAVAGRTIAKSSSEDAASEVVEKRHWIQDYVDNEFEAAKEALTSALSSQEGDDALATQAWILACDYHIAGSKDIGALIRFGEEHQNNIPAQIVVATILRLERHANRAMELLALARSRFPRDASISQAIARCHYDVEDNQSAIAELQHFGSDQFPEVAIDLAEAYEREEKLGDALQVIQHCHANHPSNKALRYKYARLAQDLGKHEVAISLLRSLQTEDPSSIEYWGYLGNSCLELNLDDVALSAYREAEKLMEKEQGSQWIVSNIGNLLINKGLPTEACNYLKRALTYEPLSEYAHDRMASALKKKTTEEKLFEKACAEGRRQIREAELKLQRSPSSLSISPNVSTVLAIASPTEA
jgi:predicted Zn-dependent protease